VVQHRAGAQTAARWEADLRGFGAVCAGPLDRAVRLNNLEGNLPVADRFSANGERIEEVRHHPAYHEAGRWIYGSGIASLLGQPGNNLHALALFYLSSHDGEAGHNCPIACTAGVVKTLLALGSSELRQLYLPRLASTDYDRLAHGAQFLTEVQGGSDVGANAVRATAVDRAAGTWRLHGEKWFCSNATADLTLVTARPEGAREGTAGLGLFLMPRRLPDGSLNSFSIRRLKDKLGTRTLATAEVDLEGAFAWQMGPLDRGFAHVMTYVIDTSRVFNAVGCAGISRRACLVAHAYARRRRAFAAPIIEYPLVQETLVDMRSETAAMVSGVFHAVHLLDRVEGGAASSTDEPFLRLAINLNKTRTAISSHEVALSGIEVLGGNGTIESFSVLPRLLRDNVVYENWEGSHNVLLMQVLRDCRRKGVHDGYFSQLEEQARGHDRLTSALTETRRELERLLEADDGAASLQMRSTAARMAWLQWATAMATDGTDPALVSHFVDRRLGPAAPRDRTYLRRLESLSRQP
jgi:acyl-CoA dehydrogenase